MTFSRGVWATTLLTVLADHDRVHPPPAAEALAAGRSRRRARARRRARVRARRGHDLRPALVDAGLDLGADARHRDPGRHLPARAPPVVRRRLRGDGREAEHRQLQPATATTSAPTTSTCRTGPSRGSSRCSRTSPSASRCCARRCGDAGSTTRATSAMRTSVAFGDPRVAPVHARLRDRERLQRDADLDPARWVQPHAARHEPEDRRTARRSGAARLRPAAARRELAPV